MKISRHFRAFLKKHGYLELPGIGRFELSTDNSIDSPEEKIEFKRTGITTLDISLVKFLCEESGTEAYVVHSDLNTFSDSVKELLMQGLEAEIPGIGYLNTSDLNHPKFTCRSIYISVPEKKIRKPQPLYLNSSFWM